MPLGIGIGNAIGWAGNPVGSGGGYTPADDPDLFEWWDAQSGISQSGGELTAWVGSVNSETADPPTVTARPIYGDSQINSLDVLTFRNDDPNYLEIDTTSWSTNVTMYFVIQADSDPLAMQLLCDVDTTTKFIQKDDGNSNASAINLGSSTEWFINGSSIGTDINQIELDSAIVSNCLLTITGLDFTGIDSIYIGCRSDIARGINAVIGDIIATSGNTLQTENENFLIDKYDF